MLKSGCINVEGSDNSDDSHRKRINSIDSLVHNFFDIVGLEDYSENDDDNESKRKYHQSDKGYAVEQETCGTLSACSNSNMSVDFECIGTCQLSSEKRTLVKPSSSKDKLLSNHESNGSSDHNSYKLSSLNKPIWKKLNKSVRSIRQGLNRSKSADQGSLRKYESRGERKKVFRRPSENESNQSSVEFLMQQYRCIVEVSDDSLKEDS